MYKISESIHSDKDSGDDYTPFAFASKSLQQKDTLVSFDNGIDFTNTEPLTDDIENSDGMMQKSVTEQFVNNCESLESCASLQRVIEILQFYAYNFNDEKKVISYLESTKFNKYLLNDYHHLLDTHLNEDRVSVNECNAQFEAMHKMVNDSMDKGYVRYQ